MIEKRRKPLSASSVEIETEITSAYTSTPEKTPKVKAKKIRK